MNRNLIFGVAATACLIVTGCEDLSPGVEPPESSSSRELEEGSNGDGGPTESPVLNASSGSAKLVKLHRGVALAQTLPSGTCMTFSVEYEFLGAGPAASSKYYWVIKPVNGAPVRQAAQLTVEGTLQSIAPSLRTENGPFSCHIVEVSSEGTERNISGEHSLR